MTNRGGAFIETCVAVAGVALVIAPLLWMLALSVRSSEGTLTLDHYRTLLLGDATFCRWLLNSARNAVLCSALVGSVAIPAGFAAVFLPRVWSGRVAVFALSIYMIPPILLLVPLVKVLQMAGITNPAIRVVLGQFAFALPLGLWLSLAAFRDLPRQLLDAAALDGASVLSAFINVGVPARLPTITAIVILAFALSWSDWLFASVLSGGDNSKTIPVGLYDLYHASVVNWGDLMAACSMSAAPVLLALPWAIRALVDRWAP